MPVDSGHLMSKLVKIMVNADLEDLKKKHHL